MTPEKLDEIERRLSVDYSVISRDTIAELVRLARIGLAAEAGDNRPVIAAFLRAAAEDGGLCEAVWEACYNTWAEFGASDKDGGRAAIIALAEHVEAGR